MALEEFSAVLVHLKKKLLYIVLIFSVGVITSFSFMGEVIKQIEYDMFFKWNIADTDKLSKISEQISSISKELLLTNPDVSKNLSIISNELQTISYNPVFVYLTPMEVIMLEFKMALIFGLIIVLPIILYYMYKGVKGRFKNVITIKKSTVLLAISSSLVLFLIGSGYAYYFMLPFFLRFLYLDAMSIGVNATFSIYAFVYFVIITTAIMGLSFELPIIMTLIVKLKIVSRQTLAYYRKHAYIILLIISAIITPDPTMFSQIMVAVPFVVLYEVSLLFMRVL